jgi:hypothetical protein
MSCSGLNIFGDDTCGGGGGLTPEQEQDLTDVVEKTINISSAVQLPNPITTLTGELDVKKIKSYEHNVELEFDDTNAILTATDITLNGAVASSGDIKVYDPTGADTDQSILKKDRLEFSGIPADNALGGIRFEDGASYKQIIMSVDKGNFPFQSRGVISVDGGTFQFNPNEFAMLNKRITLLADPIGLLDAANKQYVDQKFVDPVINSSITLENQTTPNTLLLASFATGENRIDSSGDLEINGSNLTMNLTGGTLTENVGNNKISIVSGNLTENITSAHISTALSHTFNGALTSSTSVSTPLLTGISTITNAGFDININTPGGELILNNDALVVNSVGGIRLQGALFGIALGANEITTTKTTFNDNELITKKYVDLRNFQNYSFRNVNGKTGLPGGVPGYTTANPPISNQYSLPQGDYYFRYAGTGGAAVNVVLKSLSDAGTATGDDVYQTTLANFWNIANFPSMKQTYNRNFVINADTRPVFQDPYITIGWDAPGNDIELTMLQLPPGVPGIYSLAVPDAASSIKTYISQINIATDIFPNGVGVANSLLNVYINPSSNPTSDTYPSYNVQFRRVDDVVFMKLERYFIPIVV